MDINKYVENNDGTVSMDLDLTEEESRLLVQKAIRDLLYEQMEPNLEEPVALLNEKQAAILKDVKKKELAEKLFNHFWKKTSSKPHPYTELQEMYWEEVVDELLDIVGENL